MLRNLKNVTTIARAQRAAQADNRQGEEAVPAIRKAVVKWAGDDYTRGRREGRSNKAARAEARSRRAAQAAAHLYADWDLWECA